MIQLLEASDALIVRLIIDGVEVWRKNVYPGDPLPLEVEGEDLTEAAEIMERVSTRWQQRAEESNAENAIFDEAVRRIEAEEETRFEQAVAKAVAALGIKAGE